MAHTPPTIFSRRQAAAKWARARSRQERAGSANYLVEAMADDVIERLEFMRHEIGSALVIGDVTGRLPAWLARQGVEGKIGLLGEFDEEQPGSSETFDLIVHLLGLGVVNDLPGALIHARDALKPGGLFIAAFPGAGSQPVLRELMLAADGDRPAARMHPLVDNRAATGLLQRAGFSRQVVDSYPVKVRYSSLERMIADLRDHGLTRSLASAVPPLTREAWQRALRAFAGMRDGDGKVAETFEILVLTGWK
ncbi:methyltransferase domain-containing protein [Erythrobacter litoralis]|uniref:Methyltransferase n=1 Tax=Erythrobacter litoralis (strain HTCC2594) TaxID=314225 RepID=Q2NAM4_ERYLH|nr:methyltransferase domain-containing protein [Erythrobacter litoralis]ABC63267.1 hypothetical protein ELI_05875 [Erythrobacter litoralis HTCC2594]